MTMPLRPFLKWAGGKRWLFESGQYSFPDLTGRYFEPFLGGGAAFFHARPVNAVLSDTNERLIELYTVVRDQPLELEALLREHANYHSKSYYYQVRGMVQNSPVARAARFLYLNRTCWNGLYRENLRGHFNVPIGTKETVIFASDDFMAWSSALSHARLECCDFENAIEDTAKGDFLFVDPPYTIRHNMNGFVKYNQNIFAWSDQIRLRDALVSAARRGVSFALTNADHDSVRELYDGIGSHSRLFRHSVIAGKASDRSFSTELLVLG